MFITSLDKSFFCLLVISVLHYVFIAHVCVVEYHCSVFLIRHGVKVTTGIVHATCAILLRLIKCIVRLMTLLNLEHVLQQTILIVFIIVLKLALTIVIKSHSFATVHVNILLVTSLSLISTVCVLI